MLCKFHIIQWTAKGPNGPISPFFPMPVTQKPKYVLVSIKQISGYSWRN